LDFYTKVFSEFKDVFIVFVEERAEIEFYAALQYYEQLDITGLIPK
jgi:hypothetical protein